jgi:hypothetical protein
MLNQNNNNDTANNDINDAYEDMELFEQDIKKAELTKESNKRTRDDSEDDEEPKLKKQKEDNSNESELEILGMAFRLMDKSIPNDQDSLEHIQLYEAFSGIVPSEIAENNERNRRARKKNYPSI